MTLRLINHLPESSGSKKFLQNLLEFGNPKLATVPSVFTVEATEVEDPNFLLSGAAHLGSRYAEIRVAPQFRIISKLPYRTNCASEMGYLPVYLFSHECRHLFQFHTRNPSKSFLRVMKSEINDGVS